MAARPPRSKSPSAGAPTAKARGAKGPAAKSPAAKPRVAKRAAPKARAAPRPTRRAAAPARPRRAKKPSRERLGVPPELLEATAGGLLDFGLRAAYEGNLEGLFTVLRVFGVKVQGGELSPVTAEEVFEHLQWFAVRMLGGTLEMDGRWDGESELTVEPAPGVEITLNLGTKAN